MKYNEIKISEDETHFIYNGKKLFNKTFKQILKFHKEGLAPVCDETGWYHINLQGKAVYNERYDRTFGYYFERSAIIKNNKCHHVDTQGNRVYKKSFAWCGNYQEKLCTVRDFEGNYFHLNILGKRAYNENYIYAGDFKDGYAAVRLQNGLYKHIDCNDKDLNGKLFKDLGVFHKNFATARDEYGWFHIDKKGKELYTQRYLIIEPFYNGFALVEDFENRKLVIDEAGNKTHTL